MSRNSVLPFPRLSAQTIGRHPTDEVCRFAYGMNSHHSSDERPSGSSSPHESGGRFESGRRKKDGRHKSIEELPEELQPKAQADLDKLVDLAKQSRHQFEMGDLVLRLRQYGLSLSVIETRLSPYGFKRSTLGQYAQVSEAFATPESRHGLSWFACYEAMRTYKQASSDFKQTYQPEDVARRALDAGKTARSIRKDFNLDEKSKANEANKQFALEQLEKHPHLSAQMILGKCEDVVPTLPDGSVKLFYADPPYSDYDKDPSGSIVAEGSYVDAIRSDFLQLTKAEAIDLTIRLMAMALPKIAKGGCFLLWGAGGKPASWQVLKAADEGGWACPYEIVWNKKIPVPGDFSKPYSISSEKFLVFYPKGTEPIDHTPGGEYRRSVITPDSLNEFLERQDLIEAPSPTRQFSTDLKAGRAHAGDAHIFSKPPELNKLHLLKHTYEGDLVVDLFGCSGSMSEACAQLNRRWMYIEPHKPNYYWALNRLAKYLPPEKGTAQEAG